MDTSIVGVVIETIDENVAFLNGVKKIANGLTDEWMKMIMEAYVSIDPEFLVKKVAESIGSEDLKDRFLSVFVDDSKLEDFNQAINEVEELVVSDVVEEIEDGDLAMGIAGWSLSDLEEIADIVDDLDDEFLITELFMRIEDENLLEHIKEITPDQLEYLVCAVANSFED